MKNIQKQIFVLFIFSLSLSSTFAQNKKPDAGTTRKGKEKSSLAIPVPSGKFDSTFAQNIVEIKSKVYGDSVVLRWTPKNELYWKVANQVGYIVERFTISNDSAAWPKKVFNLKPWTVDEVKTKSPKDTMTGTMATLAFTNVTKKPASTDISDLYALKSENDNRFFLSMLMASFYPRSAEKMALRLTDKTIEKGKSYLYRIYAPTGLKKLPSDTAIVYVDAKTIDQTPDLPIPLFEQNEKAVSIKLSKNYCNSRFVGYYFERSENGSNFKRLHSKPFVQIFSNLPKEESQYIVYVDSVKQNYKKYYYRVIGITPFGDLSKPSATLGLMAVDEVAPQAVSNIKAENTKGTAVVLTWQKAAMEPDLAGFMVGKSTAIEGPFIPLHDKLIPKNTLTYTDATADPNTTNYYVVSAVDTAGNSTISVPAYVIMKDETPPAKPTGLKATMDSTGLVQITWSRNAEPDLLGYLVYTSNAPDHDFTPITKGFLADEFFTEKISLRTLTEHKYYKVVAFDKSRQPSPYSDMLEVKRPDKARPTNPVFKDFLVADSLITVTWATSESADVEYQNIYRKEEGKDKDWVFLKKLSKTDKTFTDKTVKPEHWYIYTLEAVDDANLRSEKSFPIRLRPYDSGQRKGVSKVQVAAIQNPKANKITWLMPSNVSNGRILIYKKTGDGETSVIENLPLTAREFTDMNLGAKSTSYGVQIKYEKGASAIVWTSSI